MRKLFAVLVAVLLPLFALGETTEIDGGSSSFYIQITTNVTGGSFSWTNSFVYPFRVSSFILTFPSGVSTTVTFTAYRDLNTLQYQGSVVTTNDWSEVITNVYWGVTNTVTRTATNEFLSVFTNLTTRLYDSDDFGRDLWVLPKDRFVLDWQSYTNEVWVIFTGTR